jgi:hypothetical protein
MTHDNDSQTLLVARVLREVLKARRYEHYLDVKADLRAELRRLKIRIRRQRDFDEALTMVDSNRQLITVEQVTLRRRSRDEQPQNAGLSRAEAAVVYHEVMTRYFREHPRRVKDEPGRPRYFPDLVEVV